MKILVIGCKGFIGSHVFRYFSNQTEIDCWGCGVSVDYVSTKYFQIDVTNNDFTEIFEKIQFDVCINCSGAASVPLSFKNPSRDFTLNTLNVFKVLDAIRKHAPQCRFVNLSSAAVYGNPNKVPINERSNCCPVSPYGVHKLYAEEICKEFYQYYNLQTCSLRIFSAYGPGLTKQLLWDIYIKSHHPSGVELIGTGEETRDYIFIDDLVRAIDLAVKKGSFNAGVYNVASGIEVKIRDIAQRFLNALDYSGILKFSGVERSGDPTRWCADMSLLRDMGFRVDTDLNYGLIKYKEWLIDQKLL